MAPLSRSLACPAKYPDFFCIFAVEHKGVERAKHVRSHGKNEEWSVRSGDLGLGFRGLGLEFEV